jgi:hypothetical protein
MLTVYDRHNFARVRLFTVTGLLDFDAVRLADPLFDPA